MSCVNGTAFVGQFGNTGDSNHSGLIRLQFNQSDGTALDITDKALVIRVRYPDDSTAEVGVSIDDGPAGQASFAAPSATFFNVAGDMDVQAFETDGSTYNAPFAMGLITVREVIEAPT